MKMHIRHNHCICRLDRRGVALPLALLGLLLITVAVTAALISSTGEAALGRAHQDATTGLYAADGALETFLVHTAEEPATGYFPDYSLPQGASASIRSGLLSQRAENGTVERMYSVVAGPPEDGPGRSVGVLVTHRSQSTSFDENFGGALTIGGQDVNIGGTTDVRAESNACTDSRARRADAALVLDRDAQESLSFIPGLNIREEDIDRRDVSAEELRQQSIGDIDFADLAQTFLESAEFQFGMNGQSPFQLGPNLRPSDLNGWRSESHSEWNYNWGCPATLRSCSGPAELVERRPSVGIDMSAGGRDRIGANDYGQGRLAVVGSTPARPFRIGGNAWFDGIVVVDGPLEIGENTRLRGMVLVNGDLGIGGNTNIEGVVVADGSLTGHGNFTLDGALMAIGDADIVSDSQVGGNTRINYNACAIDDALRQFEEHAGMSGGWGARSGWFEVVR